MSFAARAGTALMLGVAVAALAAAGGAPAAHAHPHPGGIVPLGGAIGLERTTLEFSAPAGNTLPWGFVEGRVADHVAGYPVVIKVFSSDGRAVHFAQADVSADGAYEYRFRVMSVDGGEVIRAFQGDYTVVVYKVVYLDPAGRGLAA